MLKWRTVAVAMLVLAGVSTGVRAGDLDSPAAPNNAGSAMYTLEDIYNKLDTRAAVSKRAGAFEEPSAGPGSTGRTTDDIMGLITSRAPVAKTGAGDLSDYTEVAGEDGHASMRKGVARPSPRFTDNGDGTVTDNLTSLIWLKDAHAFGSRAWSDALNDCATLNSGEHGLTDGSSEGDWRLPNVKELQSLVDYGLYGPALSDTAGTGQWSTGDPFNNVQSLDYFYWSSTTYAPFTVVAWGVYLDDGYVGIDYKTSMSYVWPVRGGE